MRPATPVRTAFLSLILFPPFSTDPRPVQPYGEELQDPFPVGWKGSL
jgi:hypothetical protein